MREIKVLRRVSGSFAIVGWLVLTLRQTVCSFLDIFGARDQQMRPKQVSHCSFVPIDAHVVIIKLVTTCDPDDQLGEGNKDARMV
ncbi:hypothetical protein [Mesorhizobium sp. M1027]|uniref:hypothetical protein n=1 Tax=Mesorhizobium sp. M1027 TaxID=2957050 RepID=UPI003336FB7E